LRRPRTLPVLIRGDAHLLVSTPFRVSSWLKRMAMKMALSRCDAALAVGDANRQFYLTNRFPQERIFHAPHCVDNDRFSLDGNAEAGRSLRQSLGIAPTANVVLFAGKFEQKKRPDLLVEAFRNVHNDRAVLLLVGGGALEPQLKDMAGDDRRIRFLPFQNQSEIPRVYASADLIVLPSEGAGETWGLVINEAMNCCCAAIVSTHVGCGRDLVRPGLNGWRFEAGSQSGLQQVLNEALSDPERLRQYGQASCQLVRDYSYEVATQGLLQALETVSSS
jgi:glycosyltransferase involved in cell wall biosynthesis